MKENGTQKGFSLIESLVAMMVISIGMLGVAGLETYAKNSGYEAMQRTTASMLAQDMMQKMRANTSVIGNYEGYTVGNSSIGSPGTNCAASQCTTAELVVWDIWDWERQLDGATETSAGNNTGGLLNPTGCISGPGTGAAGTYTVAIAWRGKNPMTNPASSPCGQGTGQYGASDEYRRVMVMDFYISTN